MDDGRFISMRFRPKIRIRRLVREKGRELIVFYPGGEYHGVIYTDGTVISSSGKYSGTYKLNRNEVEILEYL